LHTTVPESFRGLLKFFRELSDSEFSPLRRQGAKFGISDFFSFASLRLCGRSFRIWLRLCRAMFFVVKSVVVYKDKLFLAFQYMLRLVIHVSAARVFVWCRTR